MRVLISRGLIWEICVGFLCRSCTGAILALTDFKWRVGEEGCQLLWMVVCHPLPRHGWMGCPGFEEAGWPCIDCGIGPVSLHFSPLADEHRI